MKQCSYSLTVTAASLLSATMAALSSSVIDFLSSSSLPLVDSLLSIPTSCSSVIKSRNFLNVVNFI